MSIQHVQDSATLSRPRGCLGFSLLAAGLFALLIGAAMLATSNKNFWAFEHNVERSQSGGGTSVSFRSGVNVSANTITLLLMGGGACLAGSIFVYRRNFSLRFLLICVFVIGLIGMVPGKIVKTPTAIMSSQYLFDKPFSSDQMQRLKTEMAPPRALATLPEQMLEELKISPATDIGRVIVAPADAHKPGAYLEISFSPQINREQREAIAEFYAYHFGQLCLEMAQANSSSNATTSSRPTVNNRFYKYLKEWEARRAEKLAEPER